MTLAELLAHNAAVRARRAAEAAAAQAALKQAEESKKGQRKGKKPPHREFLVVEPKEEVEQTETETNNGIEAEDENSTSVE